MKYVKSFFEALLFVLVFLGIQLLVSVVVTVISWSDAENVVALIQQAMSGKAAPTTKGVVVSAVVSSVLILIVFLYLKWSPFSRTYLRSKPWGVLAWVVVLALGTLIPSTWLAEQIPYNIPPDTEAVIAEMLHNRWGYLAIGILAPLVEEMVFRGAILRVLLAPSKPPRGEALVSPSGDDKRGGPFVWAAILLSAILFGAVHGNLQQFVHAMLVGILLGWMYYRTNSIVPGVLFHWINNTTTYVIANLIPNSEHARLVEIFGGNQQSVWLALGFSLCLMLPAIFQLWQRMKRVEDEN